MKILTTAAILMTGTMAFAAVVVQEAPVTQPPTSYLSEGTFSSGKIGEPPPKPWQCSKNTESIHVSVETPVGRPETERWVHLVDETDKGNANIRQSFAAVTNGQFQVRLISSKNGGRLFINFGNDGASKPEERAMQLSIDTDGSLLLRGEKKAKTSAQVKTGEVYLVRCDFERIQDGKALRVVAELVDEKTQRPSRVEMEIATPVPIATVRVTSVGPDTGVDYYVTDLRLVSR
jgi:hypothetical protein